MTTSDRDEESSIKRCSIKHRNCFFGWPALHTRGVITQTEGGMEAPYTSASWAMMLYSGASFDPDTEMSRPSNPTLGGSETTISGRPVPSFCTSMSRVR